MKIVKAEFVTSAVSPNQFPRQPWPEAAFIGRSNVGKSSLINSLLNKKKLVKTSATPGKTQMINFFNINEEWMFADLPGYGFAKVPPAVQKKWQKLIEDYLSKRKNLRTVVLLLDIRRKPTDLDLQMQEWLEGEGLDYILVATKSDKLSSSERGKQLSALRKAFVTTDQHELIPYSSKDGHGRKELWKVLQKRMEQKNINPDPSSSKDFPE